MSAAAIERPGIAGKVVVALRWTPCGARAKTLTFLGLCVLALATLLTLYQAPYRHTVRVGERDASAVQGFYDPEGTGDFTYRWTTDRALVRLPQGVFPGEADVVLSGNRPGSPPPEVTFALETRPNAPLSRVRSTTDFVSVPVRLPATSGSLNPADMPGLVLVPSDTVTPLKENRALGVAVERVVVFTNPLRFGPIMPPVLAILLMLGMAVALALVVLSVAPPLGQIVPAAYGPSLLAALYLALRRFDDPGRQAHAIVGFTVAALVTLMVVWRQSLAARPWVRGLGRLDGRWLLAIAVIGALAYALYASHRLFGRLYDDTHITLRYAQNLADGDGLRFNPGQRPVEGYTNFLLTVVLAGFAKVGLSLEVMAKVVSIGAAVGVVIATYWLTTIVLPEASGLLRATPSLAMAGCGWFAYYAAIGLETHLFALLVTLAICLTLRQKWPWAGVAFAGAYLTRPEGAGLWAVTLGWLIWEVWILPWLARRRSRWVVESSYAPRPRDIAAFALPFVVIVGAHELWRLRYYGVPLPNTFYDKVGTTKEQVGRGLDYVAHSVPALHPLTLVALVALLVLVPSAAVGNRAARYVALLVTVFAAYIVLVGGDFIGPRFIFHIFPLLVVLAVAGIRSLLRIPRFRPVHATGDDAPVPWGRSSPLAALSVALIALWFFLPLLPPNTFMKERVADTHMRIVTGLTALGDYLRDTAPPGATLAIEAAGVVPYISRLPTLDMLGLNDYHIAHTATASGEGVAGHEKTDPEYILAQQPTYIAVGMSKLTTGGRPGRGLDLPGFDAAYTRVALVQMTASVVSPRLVLVVTPTTDIQAAINAGYTYALYKHR